MTKQELRELKRWIKVDKKNKWYTTLLDFDNEIPENENFGLAVYGNLYEQLTCDLDYYYEDFKSEEESTNYLKDKEFVFGYNINPDEDGSPNEILYVKFKIIEPEYNLFQGRYMLNIDTIVEVVNTEIN